MLVTSPRFVVLSLCGCLSSLGTLPQADRPCCQQKSPQGPLSRGGGSCAAVVAVSAVVTLLQPGNLPRALLSFVPKHFQSPGLQLASPSLLSCPSYTQNTKAVWQDTRQAPGKTVVQWLLGAFRGLAHSSLSFANGKAGWRAQHSQPALLHRQKHSILGVVVLAPLCFPPVRLAGEKGGKLGWKCGGEKQVWQGPAF